MPFGPENKSTFEDSFNKMVDEVLSDEKHENIEEHFNFWWQGAGIQPCVAKSVALMIYEAGFKDGVAELMTQLCTAGS